MSSFAYSSVSRASADVRAEFIRKTYLHLALAILGFIGIEFVLLNSPLADLMLSFLGGSQYGWLLVLGGFIAVSYIAERWARSSTSLTMQYLGLGLYVFAEAIIFVPLLYIASTYAPDIIPKAGMITLLLFAALTFYAFTSRKDFSFLGGFLAIGGFIALGIIVLSIIFGFTLGLLFSVVMVIFAAVAILYHTSNVLHHYRPDQYVAASLALFAAVALLFWYVLRILLSFSRR